MGPVVKNFPYMPGKTPGRVEYKPNQYNPYQEALWQAINECYYAWVEGRTQFYFPSPGGVFDLEDFVEWRTKAVKAWDEESKSRGKKVTRGLTIDDLPDNMWLWLYERMLSAGDKPKNHIQSWYGGV